MSTSEINDKKNWIDAAPYIELLRRWRFSEGGNSWFQGEVGDYYAKVMAQKRDADPEAAVAASKAIGW